jgi:hypothetical protein
MFVLAALTGCSSVTPQGRSVSQTTSRPSEVAGASSAGVPTSVVARSVNVLIQQACGQRTMAQEQIEERPDVAHRLLVDAANVATLASEQAAQQDEPVDVRIPDLAAALHATADMSSTPALTNAVAAIEQRCTQFLSTEQVAS